MKLKPILNLLVETRAEEKTRNKYKLLWKFTQSDDADTANFEKLEKREFGGKVPEQIFALMSKSSNMEDFINKAMHLNSPDEIQITSGKDKWKLKRMQDSTHFKMMRSDSNNWNAATVWHIGQLDGEPYQDDVRSWLKHSGNPDGKKY